MFHSDVIQSVPETSSCEWCGADQSLSLTYFARCTCCCFFNTLHYYSVYSFLENAFFKEGSWSNKEAKCLSWDWT